MAAVLIIIKIKFKISQHHSQNKRLNFRSYLNGL